MVSFAAGCSGSEDLGPLGDPAAAQHRIDSLIDGTVKAITPAVTPPQYIGFFHREERNTFGNDSGYAKVWREGALEERVSEEKKPVLLDQVEKYWKDQGCTVDAAKPDGRRVTTSAICPDRAHVMVDTGGSAVSVKAWVEKTKFREGGDPFPDTQTRPPLANVAPAGQQDDPYWSH
ncbi:hypothetical protein [Kitasatospora sp. NPDC057198]|uniref:hypothetical protein n=1 Tax=Kitasatospora sp. NPDC057198 TaxID=3346046 RepID=UPI00362E561C